MIRATSLLVTLLIYPCSFVTGFDYSEWALPLPEERREFGQDADGDGVSNGMEYLAGSDPLAVDGGGGPALRFALREEMGERQPQLELILPVNQPGDVLVRLEVSGDLDTWAPLANRFALASWVVQRGILGASPAGEGKMALHWTGETEAAGQGGPASFYRLSAELIQNTDLDGDGLNDQWERQYGLDPGSDDSALDPDRDGLTNSEEQAAGTNPHLPDTDGDGCNDACELAMGRSAAVADGSPGATAPQPGTGLLVLTP